MMTAIVFAKFRIPRHQEYYPPEKLIDQKVLWIPAKVVQISKPYQIVIFLNKVYQISIYTPSGVFRTLSNI